MGWQEDSENDETCAPLTEDEMREFRVISEQVRGPESGPFCVGAAGPYKASPRGVGVKAHGFIQELVGHHMVGQNCLYVAIVSS